jgi:transcription initiation factor TFIID TATA-box-binding protein
MKVVNFLATAKIAEFLDLHQFSDETGVDFEPDRFPGMAYKISVPKVCVLLFRSGKSVITGAKTVEDIEIALAIVHEKLKSLKHDVYENYIYDIGNVVVTHNLGQELNLANLTLRLDFTKTEWEPEQFPGLIYNIDRDGLNSVALVFSSGKCVITGNSTIEDAELATKLLTEDILKATE